MKYNITRFCGHDEKVDILGSNAHGERDRRAAFEANKLCRVCWQKEQLEEALDQGAEILEVKYSDFKNLPEYQGLKSVPNSYDKDTKTIKIIQPKETTEKTTSGQDDPKLTANEIEALMILDKSQEIIQSLQEKDGAVESLYNAMLQEVETLRQKMEPGLARFLLRNKKSLEAEALKKRVENLKEQDRKPDVTL